MATHGKGQWETLGGPSAQGRLKRGGVFQESPNSMPTKRAVCATEDAVFK